MLVRRFKFLLTSNIQNFIMRNILKLILPAIALLLLFNAFAVVETNAQVLNDILTRMENNRNALSSLRSGIKMDKYDPLIDTHDVLTGEVMYVPKTAKKDMYVRINWEKPVKEQLAVVNGKYVLYKESINQVYTGSADKATGSAKANGALGFLSMSRAQLKANYTVKYMGEETIEGGETTWHLQLTPKTVTSYKSADLWVDVNGMPVQAKIVEKNNDTTTILLYDIKTNVIRDGKSLFEINYPKNAKVVSY